MKPHSQAVSGDAKYGASPRIIIQPVSHFPVARGKP